MEGRATSANFSLQPDTLNYKIPAWKIKQLSELKGRVPQPVVFWTSEWYLNAAGASVKISYASNIADSEILAQRFIGERVIGFDMEWKSPRTKGVVFTTLKENVSLIQLARDGEVGLFHIARHKGETTSQLFAPTLLKILRSPDIVKTGVAILGADARQLRKYAQIEARGLFELSRLHKLLQVATVEQQEKRPKEWSDALTALAKQTEIHLGFPLAKGKARTNDWTMPLTEAQRQYAADDAYVGLVLYHMMNAKRLNLAPIPTLPGLVDRTEATTPIVKAAETDPVEAKNAELMKQGAVTRREERARVRSKSKDEDDNDERPTASDSDDAFETGEDEPDRATAKPRFRMPPPLTFDDMPEANLPARPFMQSLQSVLGQHYGLLTADTDIVTPTRSNLLSRNKRKREISPLQVADANKRSNMRTVDKISNQADRGMKLLPALQKLLTRLVASSTPEPPSTLITKNTLERIASIVPKDIGALCRIPGAVPLLQYCEAHEISLLAFVHEHG